MVARAEQRLGERGQGTILFLDEVHRFNKAQQDALLPSVESGLLTLIGATTENPYFEVNPPLLSRSTLFRLHALDEGAARGLIDRALAAEDAAIADDAADLLATRANGDGRHTIGSLEVAIALARQRAEAGAAGGTVAGGPVVELADAEAALGTKALRYGRDDHYDVISAFIKSIRGSDPDAGALLAGHHARSRRGRPLHRSPPGDPGLGGHRRGRPALAARRQRRGGGRGVRGACPRPSSTWPRPWST